MKDGIWLRVGFLFLVGVSFWKPEVTGQIQNPGFETAGASASNAANWTVSQAVGGPVYGVRTNLNPHTGSFHFFVYLASTGAGPVVEFYQVNIPVTGGTHYTLSFFANRLSGSAGDNDEYNIQWFDTNSAFLGSTGYTSYSPRANVYSQIVVYNIVAPTNATKANLFFHFAGAAVPSWSANIDIDDVSLSYTNISYGGPTLVTNQV
jgi:hypothetical protein